MKQKRDFKLLMQVLENIDLCHSTALPRQNKKKEFLKNLTGYWQSSTLCTVVKVGVL